MVQAIEKEELEYELIIIPAKEEKVVKEKKIEKKAAVKQAKKKKLLKKHAKQHEELINVQKLKNKVYGNISGMRNINY